jgi:hypothetical protein
LQRPEGLDEFEQHVMASDAPPYYGDQASIRELLRYERRLERDMAGRESE